MNWFPWSGAEVSSLIEWFFLTYFIAINIGYLTLNLICVFSLRRSVPAGVLNDMPQIYSGLEPPVTIIVPAYNEEATIVASIRSILHMNYPRFEIVIVNDGSKDGTLDELKNKLSLISFPEAYRSRLATRAVQMVYQSTKHPNIRVIDKKNGGKADSINAGINIARYPLFCVVDADSVLQPDSLRKVVQPFLEDKRVVASGGTIRVANGCKISGGFISKIGLPSNLLAMMQVVEYIRAFLMGRLGWSVIDGLLIISGAFGVFHKETVISVGGFRHDTVGEDMELIVRIHRMMRQQKRVYRIVFLPDPVAWTEVPEDLHTLMSQRTRWQRGLSESLIGNFGLMFSRNGGTPGWLAFPFMVIFEWLGPLVEVTGYILMFIFIWLGYISWPVFMVFLLATIGLGILVSITSLLLEDMSFNLYDQRRQLSLLIIASVVENLGFRQLNSFWRLMGLIYWLFGRKRKWGKMRRSGAWQKNLVRPS
ncbi:poly-beta-1,6-N-acetyl-D-glucosamine synthase [mine drainage metagenome]|uniref:Poly-beta-1,6-N-acetyl-D-glucosamine synthase n=1 Tax=mine drainage metagenome TaxID=410659 RepID=A0A1J5RQT6_9ZZZZ